MASDKNELEDEMSRFEREIAGQLPPPPKLPNFSHQNAMQPPAQAQMPMNPQQSANTSTHSAGPMSHPPPFPGIGHSMPPFSSSPQQFPSNQASQSNINMARMPQPPMHQMMQPHPQTSGGPPPQLPMTVRPPMGMPQMPMMGGQPGTSNPIAMPPTPLPAMTPMQVPQAASMPQGMSMMSSPMQYTVPMQIQPPTVPLDDYHQPRARPVGNPMAVTETKGLASNDAKKDGKKKKVIRLGGGEVWEDDSLASWDPNDFRIFCGDLGNEVTDDQLYRAFSKYPSLLKAKVIRDKKSQKTKGYGFVSFKNPQEYLKAMREMNGKYLGNRPIKLRKSTWKDRNIEVVKKKDREKKKLGLR